MNYEIATLPSVARVYESAAIRELSSLKKQEEE